MGDERSGGQEDVVEGEVILIKQETQAVRGFVGFKQATRNQSFEPDIAKKTNVGIGLSASF